MQNTEFRSQESELNAEAKDSRGQEVKCICSMPSVPLSLAFIASVPLLPLCLCALPLLPLCLAFNREVL